MKGVLHGLENLTALQNSSLTKERPSQLDRILKIAEEADLFHSPDGDAFANVHLNRRVATFALRGEYFRHWLRRRYYEDFGTGPGKQHLNDAVATIEAKALFLGEEWPVFVRVAGKDDRIYVDLANDCGQVVEISACGWKILDDSPVNFLRSKAMLPLPSPASTGDEGIPLFRKLLPQLDEDQFRLILAWLIGAINPNGPYLILVLNGEHGSGKSTIQRVLRNLIDPNSVPLRRPPYNPDDLMIAAKRTRVLAFDNISSLPEWLSDDLCRVATGGGVSKRKLYEDDEETILKSKQPIILNGIDEFVTRGDLASRAIALTLPGISGHRRLEADILREFERAHPSLLALLFDAASVALRDWELFSILRPPRMADAWKWITVAETALGFELFSTLSAFHRNQASLNEAVLGSSPVAQMIQDLVASGPWIGTAEELRLLLNSRRPKSPDPDWPRNAKGLSDQLRRIVPALRQVRIEISFEKTNGSGSRRLITIRKTILSDACDARDANSPGLKTE